MKKAKPRKPKALKSKEYYYAGIGYNYSNDPITLNIYIGGVDSMEYPKQLTINDLRFAKRLHAWLGKAIAYLEAKESK